MSQLPGLIQGIMRQLDMEHAEANHRIERQLDFTTHAIEHLQKLRQEQHEAVDAHFDQLIQLQQEAATFLNGIKQSFSQPEPKISPADPDIEDLFQDLNQDGVPDTLEEDLNQALAEALADRAVEDQGVGDRQD